jgi:hypothetical protein
VLVHHTQTLGKPTPSKTAPRRGRFEGVAEAVRFELTEGSHLRRFSRPLD